jgi:hypothetical protein
VDLGSRFDDMELSLKDRIHAIRLMTRSGIGFEVRWGNKEYSMRLSIIFTG